MSISPDTLTKILRNLDESYHNAAEAVVNGDSLGRYQDELLKQLTRSDYNLLHILDFGVNNLPANEARPDEALAAYFFIISAVRALPESIRTFAMDAMIYCKNDMDTTTGTAEILRHDYESLRKALG